MKKRMICAILCVLLTFSGCSLTPGSSEKETPSESPAATAAPSPEDTDSTPEATEVPEATEEPQSEPESKAEPEPPSAPVDFAVNHYALPLDAAAYLGDYKKEYKKFVDAILTYDDSFTFSDAKAKETILGVINRFPLVSLCEAFDIDFGTTKTPITYKASKEDFQNKVKAFEEEITRIIMAGVFSDDTEIERAVYLYNTVASYAYNNAVASDAYVFFTEKMGSSFGFSEALCYLLTQVDSKAQLATGITDAGKDHRWVILQMNGKSYNMDPSFENGATGGKGLAYFIMSDAQRKKTGCSVPYTTGENGYFKKASSGCSDTQFDKVFSETTAWKLDRETHILYLAHGGSDGYTSSLRTDTFEAIY